MSRAHAALTVAACAALVGVVNLACRGAHESNVASPTAAPAVVLNEPREVEVACGACRFGMSGDSCALAVRIDGHAYLVSGTGIDDHGDAHASDGFCNAVRRARVSGACVDGRFVVRSFELLP